MGHCIGLTLAPKGETLDRRPERTLPPHEREHRPLGSHYLDTCRLPGRIRTGPSPDRKNPQGTSRIQNPAHVFLPFGLRNPQKLRSGRLHLLPADRHTAQSPPFSGHRPPRNRHLRQIRILDQPAHRAAPPLDPQLHRIGHLPPQLDLLPPLRRLLAHGTRKFRHDLRSEQRFQKITGRTGLRQRRSRRRHPLRPGCRNCGCGEKNRPHRTVQRRHPSVDRRLDLGTGRRPSDPPDKR